MTYLKNGNSGSLKEPSSYTARHAEGSLVQQGCSEHEVYKNVLEAYDMYGKKRDNYRKYGTLFIILSAIGFLALMFGLESKITFLILWVITDYICAALMIRAEYRYHEFAVLLGYKETDDDEDDTAEIEGEQKSPDTADNSGQEQQNTVTNADRADKQEE